MFPVWTAGLQPFFFYDGLESAPRWNYDLTGADPNGRFTVCFVGGWSQSVGIGKTDVEIELVEVGLMLTLKPDVRITGLRPEIILAIVIAERAYAEIGCELMLTSAIEGLHGRASLHFAGCAVDFRTSNVPADKLQPLVEKI